ncbi:MAG TPA: hypothetical protein VMY15_05140 [Candidatus Latescibacteria bacterium]|nr:hypothetical protein [Candidatus Latescibacterota bacterium]
MPQSLSKSPGITLALLISFLLLTGPSFASSLLPKDTDSAKPAATAEWSLGLRIGLR